MATTYSKLFQKECENRFGITRKFVRSAISQPDREQRLTSQGLSIIMYSKKIGRGDYVLVNTHIHRENQVVDLALRIKKELVERINTDLPFPLMRALAYKHGLYVRVGEHESKFIYNEIIPVSSHDIKRAIRIPNPDNRPLLSTIWVRMLQNNMGALAQCALVYCIDMKEYRAWLKGRE